MKFFLDFVMRHNSQAINNKRLNIVEEENQKYLTKKYIIDILIINPHYLIDNKEILEKGIQVFSAFDNLEKTILEIIQHINNLEWVYFIKFLGFKNVSPKIIPEFNTLLRSNVFIIF